jgi:hypothetical protein
MTAEPNVGPISTLVYAHMLLRWMWECCCDGMRIGGLSGYWHGSKDVAEIRVHRRFVDPVCLFIAGPALEVVVRVMRGAYAVE